MTYQVSRFYPQTEAPALTCEHWDKLSWENRSPSGILFLIPVHCVPRREIDEPLTEKFSAFELLHQAVNLSWTNTKENWYGKRKPRNDINPVCSPSLPRRHARRSARRPAPAHRGHALALQGARRRSVAGRAAGDDPGARALLDDRLRLAQGRGETERAPSVHHRDRRGGHPLHPRAVAARERVAADRDARLARLGRRAARLRRPADGPDRTRRTRRGRVRPRAAVPARLRLLRRADRARLERRAHRANLGGADAPPRRHPLRRPGPRPGRLRHRPERPPGPRAA